MAHYVEPMDIDDMDVDYDKENSIHHSNVLTRTPCTEKGYEELDVSELNMKLRYSITPVSSPMSKSYTANCLDNKNNNADDITFNNAILNENGNLTRSLNSAINMNDSTVKSLKALPLQALPTDQFVDSNRNPSVLRPLDSTGSGDANVTVTVCETNHMEENLSLQSSSSSIAHTPEAITPTKEIKSDGGSPIIRGLKSVFNLFRPSQSPIPPAEDDDNNLEHKILSPNDEIHGENKDVDKQLSAKISTPIALHKNKEANLSKRNSPHKESIVFNDDLEKELQWKDETTIIFSKEKIPIHKLFYQQPKSETKDTENQYVQDKLNMTEYMDISNNDSDIQDKTMSDLEHLDINSNANDVNIITESDSEFVDCETTFLKTESHVVGKDTEIGNNLVENDNFNITSTIKYSHETESKNLDDTKDCVHTIDSVKTGLSLEINDITKGIDIVYESRKDDNLNKALTELVNSVEHKTNISENDTTNNKNVEENRQNITLEGQAKSSVNEEITMNKFEASGSIKHNTNVANDTAINKETNTLMTQTPDTFKTVLNCEINTGAVTDNIIQSQNTDLHSIKQLLPYNKKDQNAEELPANLPLPDEDDLDSLVLDTVAKCYDTNTDVIKDSQNDSQFVADTQVEKSLVTSELKSADNTLQHGVKPLLLSNFVVEDNIQMQDSNFVGMNIEVQTGLEAISVSNILEKSQQHESNVEQNQTVHIDEQITAKYDESEPQSAVDIENERSIDVTYIKTETIVTDVTEETASKPQVKLEESTEQIQILSNLGLNMIQEYSQQNVVKEMDPVPEFALVIVDKETQEQSEFKQLEHKCKEPILQLSVLSAAKEDKFDESLEGNLDHSIQPAHQIGLSVPLNNTAIDVATEVIPVTETNITNLSQSTVNNISDKDVVDQTLSTAAVITCDNLNNSHLNNIIVEQSVLSDNGGVSQNLNGNVTEIEDISASLTACAYNDNLNNIHQIEATVYGILTSKSDGTDVLENTVIAMTDEEKVKVINKTIDANLNNIHEEETQIENTLNEVQQNDTITLDTIASIEESKPAAIKDTNMSMSVDISTSGNDENSADILLNEQQVIKKDKMDEEIIISDNNSPYVSVCADTELVVETKTIENFAEVDNSNVSTSPPIKSKGYNFNFEEIDDPFATKTNIRMSPTPCVTSNQSFEVVASNKRDLSKNKRKSQPERKKPASSVKKTFNATFDGAIHEKSIEGMKNTRKNVEDKTVDYNQVSIKECNSTSVPIPDTSNTMSSEMGINLNIKNIESEIKTEIAPIFESKEKVDIPLKVNNTSACESITSLLNENKNASSSEHSTYYSAGTSSSEGIEHKNVFNLPEIDDMNFNPFATKSKLNQSPPLSLKTDDLFCVTTNTDLSSVSSIVCTQNDLNATVVLNESDKHIADFAYENKSDMETEEESLNNTTSSSNDEKQVTIREILETEKLTTLNDVNKISEFDGEKLDLMQFTDLSAQEYIDDEELFIDAEAFEFLMNKNKSKEISDSGKESLFLKFDPLFAGKVTSEGVVAALSNIQKRQSTPYKLSNLLQKDLNIQESPIAGPSNINVTKITSNKNDCIESNDDLNTTSPKPMMAVSPAVNPVASPRNKSSTPTTMNRRSLTFTSPAMAVIDRLLSLSSNNSLLEHDNTTMQANREQNDTGLDLAQLRELLAEKELHVHQLRNESKELKDRLTTLESQMRSLKSESAQRLNKINELNEHLSEKNKMNKSMVMVVEEYERTIASLITESEQDKKRHTEERNQLLKEREEQTAHLTSIEVSFNDLHTKYEKSKQIILGFKANEDAYQKSLKDFEETVAKMHTNYDLLKQHATSKLNHANQELERLKKSHEAEVLKLNAMIKRKELHITSLEESLAQKTKANDDLTAICDELINKVG